MVMQNISRSPAARRFVEHVNTPPSWLELDLLREGCAVFYRFSAFFALVLTAYSLPVNFSLYNSVQVRALFVFVLSKRLRLNYFWIKHFVGSYLYEPHARM
jgi:hypothetical protein